MNKKIKITLIENLVQFMGRKNFKRNASLACLSVFIVVNTSTGVMAMTMEDMDKIPINIAAENNKNRVNQNLEQKPKPYGVLKDRISNNEEIIQAKTLEEAKVDDVSFLKPSEEKSVDTKAVEAQLNYTLKELSAMSYQEMVNTIASLEWRNIDGLFKYSTDSQEFYGDRARVKYIIEALDTRAKTFTGTNNNGIPTIVEVLRSGFY